MSAIHTRVLPTSGVTNTRLTLNRHTANVGIALGATLGVTSVTQGARGLPGASARISSAPNNRTVLGPDGGVFTPEVSVDPLAYYILAKD